MNPAPPLKHLDEPFDTFEAPLKSRKDLLGFSPIYLTGYLTDTPRNLPPRAHPCA